MVILAHISPHSHLNFQTDFSNSNVGRAGDRIVVVVQKHRGAADNLMTTGAARVRRGDIRHAVVVRTKYPAQREDGSVIRFDDNACVLVNKSGDPVGTRVNGIVAKELRRTKWTKILSMATRTL